MQRQVTLRFLTISVNIALRSETIGALPQVRETRIKTLPFAIGKRQRFLRFPIFAMLFPAQWAHGFNPPQGN